MHRIRFSVFLVLLGLLVWSGDRAWAAPDTAPREDPQARELLDRFVGRYADVGSLRERRYTEIVVEANAPQFEELGKRRSPESEFRYASPNMIRYRSKDYQLICDGERLSLTSSVYGFSLEQQVDPAIPLDEQIKAMLGGGSFPGYTMLWCASPNPDADEAMLINSVVTGSGVDELDGAPAVWFTMEPTAEGRARKKCWFDAQSGMLRRIEIDQTASLNKAAQDMIMMNRRHFGDQEGMGQPHEGPALSSATWIMTIEQMDAGPGDRSAFAIREDPTLRRVQSFKEGMQMARGPARRETAPSAMWPKTADRLGQVFPNLNGVDIDGARFESDAERGRVFLFLMTSSTHPDYMDSVRRVDQIVRRFDRDRVSALALVLPWQGEGSRTFDEVFGGDDRVIRVMTETGIVFDRNTRMAITGTMRGAELSLIGPEGVTQAVYPFADDAFDETRVVADIRAVLRGVDVTDQEQVSKRDREFAAVRESDDRDAPQLRHTPGDEDRVEIEHSAESSGNIPVSCVADFDLDGVEDLVIGGQRGGVVLFDGASGESRIVALESLRAQDHITEIDAVVIDGRVRLAVATARKSIATETTRTLGLFSMEGDRLWRWTVENIEHTKIYALDRIAVGDLDGDGAPEISTLIAFAADGGAIGTGQRLVVFDADGGIIASVDVRVSMNAIKFVGDGAGSQGGWILASGSGLIRKISLLPD